VRGRQPHYAGQQQGLLDKQFLSFFSIVSHVRAAEMKLKQNNLVNLRLKFSFSFISVSLIELLEVHNDV